MLMNSRGSGRRLVDRHDEVAGQVGSAFLAANRLQRADGLLLLAGHGIGFAQVADRKKRGEFLPADVIADTSMARRSSSFSSAGIRQAKSHTTRANPTTSGSTLRPSKSRAPAQVKP